MILPIYLHNIFRCAAPAAKPQHGELKISVAKSL